MILEKSTANCSECPFLFEEEGICHEYVPGISLSCGQPSAARLLVLGEAPALDEKLSGRPLSPQGKAGGLLDDEMRTAGLDDVPRYFANVVMCTNLKFTPSSRRKWKTFNPPEGAWNACALKWQSLVREVNPEVILLLGKIPMHVFGFGDFHNKGETLYSVAETPFKGTEWAPNVVLTYHPSGLHGIPSRQEHFRNSLQLVRTLLASGTLE